MSSYVVPGQHQTLDAGHPVDHDAIATDLTLIQAAVPVVAGGLTGATAATRFVGGTSSGAPASGTFAAGDFSIDQSGKVWVCTAAGSPGTWASAAGTSMTNPMTTAGDLIDGGTAGAPQRLAVGSNGQVLQVTAGAPAWGAVPQLADYAPTGLTGATSASRYVGATASGAPGSGTFVTGDFIVDQSGKVWVCTAGGTPGTWANAGSSSGVSTFNSRSGAVTPGNADYLAVPTGGLTGATAAVRFVGGTASGAPGSGTFSTGDFIIDQSGHIYVCTAGGSPGTWANAGSSSGVSTFNSRSGAVTPGNADYLAVPTGGLTGATTATRFVGGTASAAPASGTFSTGDFVVAATGVIFICTSGGSPGTWVNAGSLYALLSGATFTGYTAPAVVALSDASTITVNAALGNDFRVTITANRTMGAPSNPVDGQRIDFQVTQDGTGSRTITWNSVYDFGTDGAPTLTTTASKGDVIGFIYYAASSKWRCAGWKLGFA